MYSAKKDLPKECTLLCGTAVGLLLGIICTELKIFVSTRESIIQLLLVAGKMSIFIFLFPFCYFYLTKLFVSHNYIFILCYSSSPKGQSLEAMQPLRLYFLSRFMALHDFLSFLLIVGASSVENREVTNPGILKIGCFKFRLPAAKYKPTTQLSIVMGILSQKNKMLLATYSETLHKVCPY